jgi:hypothetical protein
MGRLPVDSSGVISGRIYSNGDINAKKVGDSIDAPAHIFGKDTGQVERMRLMGYLLGKGTRFRSISI